MGSGYTNKLAACDADRRGAGAESELASLVCIDVKSIPADNPVQLFYAQYVHASAKIADRRLPTFGDILQVVEPILMDYCLVLMPMQSEPLINFQTLHRGHKIPGSQIASFKFGELYTDYLLPHAVAERLGELTSCLCLRICRFSVAQSARRASRDMRVYRGIFPVWMEDHSHHAVILVIAPA